MNIVLVGAGGTGISSLGFLLRELGYTNIIGVDSTESQITQALQEAGVKTLIGINQYVVQAGDIIIYSDACINSTEVLQAKQLYTNGIKGAQAPYSYFEFLGEISKYFETISVAGTHGKSTTTAILVYTMQALDPQFGLGILGALVPQLNNKNYRVNKNDEVFHNIQTIFTYIVTGKQVGRDESLRKKYRFAIEADEFNRHFLHLDTDQLIILNAELDHGDVYKDETDYLNTFVELIYKTKYNAVALEGEKGISYLKQQAPKLAYVHHISINSEYIFGEHIDKNVSLIMGLLKKILYTGDSDDIKKLDGALQETISGFTGLWRRMELIYKNNNGGLVYTDYGHHPTEINAVYTAMRKKYTDKKLVAIFQPHQARRVLQFRREFVQVLKQFDEVIIYDIYAARENVEELLREFPIPGHDTSVTPSITELGALFAKAADGIYTTDFNDVTTRIEAITNNEVVCIFSAGNIDFALRKYFGK